jgi:hypothetical protein
MKLDHIFCAFGGVCDLVELKLEIIKYGGGGGGGVVWVFWKRGSLSWVH